MINTFLSIMKFIIFMTSCTLVISYYKGLYNANMDVCCSIGHFWQRFLLILIVIILSFVDW